MPAKVLPPSRGSPRAPLTAFPSGIAAAIRAKLNANPADISGVMGDIGKLLDASITGVAMPYKPAPVMDLSKIDFEALRKRFKESKHRNTDLEVLKAAIRARAILSVGLQVGLRRAEIAALKVGDLHQNRGFDSLRIVRKGGSRDACHPSPGGAADQGVFGGGQAWERFGRADVQAAAQESKNPRSTAGHASRCR